MKEKIKIKAITSTAYWLAKLTNGTLRLKVKGEEKIKKVKKAGKSIIFAVWHGQLWIPAYYWKDRGYVGLASKSRDGEYISRILQHLGWEMVRGSTSKGGARSLLKLVRKLREGKTVAITPDGPTGPRHQVKSGIIYLAYKTDSMIIPVGTSSKLKKVFSSWDQFELPYPFSRAGLVYGNPLEVKKELTEENKKNYQFQLEQRMKEVINKAENILED